MRPETIGALATVLFATGGCRSAPDLILATTGLPDRVSVVDAVTGAIVDSVPVDPRPAESDEPHAVAVAPNGRHWYVTVAHGQPTLWKFEARRLRLVGRVALPLPGAGRIGITPDGRYGVVPDYYRDGGPTPGRVAVIRLHDLRIEQVLTLCPAPHDAVADPAGRRVAITCSGSDEIVLLDTATWTEAGRFPTGPDPGPPGAPRYHPLNLVWTPRGDAMIVTANGTDEIVRFSPDGTLTARVKVGRHPTQLALTPDGRTLVVANRGEGSLSVLDAGDLTQRKKIALGIAHPHGVVAASSRAFVGYEGDTNTPGGIVGVDLEAGRVLWTTPAGTIVLGVARLGARRGPGS